MQIQRRSFLLLLLCVFFALPLHAETNVSGHYDGGQGNQVTIQLSVAAPPPAAFIVLQQLPAGVQLVNASPAPSGFNGRQVKWLFKHPHTGGTTISMQLSKPVAVNQLQGEIRFRHPKNGDMFKKRIK